MGREKECDRHKGGTLFADLASGKFYIHHQVSLNAEETLVGKACFEREAALPGVKIRSCHTDNGIFTAQSFMDEIRTQEQNITFSGVGAHRQNGVAERAIGTTFMQARTQLLHSQLRWTEQTPISLWPMSTQHASQLNNTVPGMQSGLTPDEIFSKTTSDHSELLNLKPWGRPAHVLDPTLQDGKKLPKWKPRSRRGQFLGWSPLHASNVAMIRNLTTGCLSPQFHIVFDPWFETVSCDEEEPPESWPVILSHHQHQNSIEDDVMLADEWLSKEELADRWADEQQRASAQHQPNGQRERRQDDSGADRGNANITSRSERVDSRANGIRSRSEGDATATVNLRRNSEASEGAEPETREAEAIHHVPPDQPSSLRLSTRVRKQTQMMNIQSTNIKSCFATLARVAELRTENKWTQRSALAFWLLSTLDPEDGFMDMSVPGLSLKAFKAAKTGRNPDLPNFREAMEGPHSEEFKKAMEKEIAQLEEHGAWQGVLTEDAPTDKQIIPLTWVFRMKRLPNGDFDKFKARICVRGDLQEEEGEVFAPVVKWSTIRIVLSFALRMNLKTRQIDFDNAFVQSELKEKERVFVRMPPMIRSKAGIKNMVLMLLRALCGM